MDFWVGRWGIEFEGPDGNTVLGTNTVLQSEGRVYELFTAPIGGAQYVGVSVTAKDGDEDRWLQEYWDSDGYRAWYEGGWDGDRFILVITGQGGHPGGARRLVWHGITPDAMSWDNEKSEDGGSTWTSTWNIRYKRLPPAAD